MLRDPVIRGFDANDYRYDTSRLTTPRAVEDYLVFLARTLQDVTDRCEESSDNCVHDIEALLVSITRDRQGLGVVPLVHTSGPDVVMCVSVALHRSRLAPDVPFDVDRVNRRITSELRYGRLRVVDSPFRLAIEYYPE